jgi:hypothetical protein
MRLLAVTHVLHEVFGFRSPGEPLPLDLLTAGGATSLYDGLAAAMMRPSEPGRRQLIVAFTDGHDTTSIVDQALAIDIARRTDALVDVVMPPGRGRAAVPDAESSALDALTLPTAGEVLLLDSRGSVSDAFRSLLNDFRAGYLLRYIPRGVTAKGWHEVIVTVTRPGQYDVRARKSYSG